MTLNEFAKTYKADCHTDLGALMWHPTMESIRAAGQRKVDIHFVMLMTRGMVTMRIGDREHVVTPHCYVDTVGCLDSVEMVDASADADGYVLLTTERFVKHAFRNRFPFEPEYLEYQRRNPVTLIEARAAIMLADAFGSLERTIYDCDNIHRDALITCRSAALFMEISNHFARLVCPGQWQACVSSRKLHIFKSLMELLKSNARCHHSVEFYASKLCITPQYLGRVVFELTGKPASPTVSSAVVAEIKYLLADSSLSMKDIVAAMSFSDQAVFTKFFKRHTGLTPKQYRNGA